MKIIARCGNKIHQHLESMPPLKHAIKETKMSDKVETTKVESPKPAAESTAVVNEKPEPKANEAKPEVKGAKPNTAAKKAKPKKSKPKYPAATVKAIAEKSWWRKTSVKALARAFDLEESDIIAIRKTTEYHNVVQNLMLGQRSSDDFEKWVNSKAWNPDMKTHFGEHMGIAPSKVPGMVKAVREVHQAVANGKRIKLPTMLDRPVRSRK